MAWRIIFTDTFGRTDSTTVGNDWLEYRLANASGRAGVYDGTLLAGDTTSFGTEIRLRRTTSVGIDRGVQVTVAEPPISAGYIDVHLANRGYDANLFGGYGYMFRIASASVEVRRLDSGTATVIHTYNVGSGVLAGHTVRLDRVGSSLVLRYNGAEVATVVDDTYLTYADGNTYTVGIRLYAAPSATLETAVDDFLILSNAEIPSGIASSSASMGYLIDGSLTLTGALREYDATVTEASMFELGTLDIRCHDYEAFSAARYMVIGDGDELYRIERLTLEGTEVIVHGRSALCDLESRVITTAIDGTGTSGALIQAILATLTAGRATNLTAGNLTGGTTATRRIEPGVTVYEAIRSTAAADGLGLKTRYVNGVCYVDLIIPATSTVELGDGLRNVNASTHETDTAPWRNYAYVVGEFSGSPVTVSVDQTSGAERRELYVDSITQQGSLTLAQYQAALAVEGAQALSDTRKVEYVDAQTEALVNVGDVCWYDGIVWSGWLLCTSVVETRENGTSRRAILGEVPADLKKTLRRTR